ncbi:MAG: hydrogenase expression/formation protein HypE [Planctomycetota bacterium]|nr:hydrogenase expression/formation protein HypE [Planctomycetota bacterium]
MNPINNLLNEAKTLYLTCPSESTAKDVVLLAQGEGGRLMRKFIHERIVPILGTSTIEDAVRIPNGAGELAITTDSYVVSPLFFPGGDMGSLAVNGTVNDLAVAGAEALCITLGLIIEEGLPFEILDRILQSVAKAARECGVAVVAGDTKVVPRGAADKLFINTTGVGRFRSQTHLSCQSIQEGDILLVSGPIGQHGVAVLAARENLRLTPEPQSDCAALHHACAALLDALGGDLRAMRDATRGGVSAVLHEWSEASHSSMKLDESKIPVSPEVRGVCELLGLDPLYVANEGTFVAAVAPASVDLAIEVLQSHRVSGSAKAIGCVLRRQSSPVVIERMLGVLQPVDEPSGSPLPRIC